MKRFVTMVEESGIVTVGGAVLLCLAMVHFTRISLLGSLVPFSVTPVLLQKFEHHFWIFTAAFLAIGYVSRGHLWSFGINSKNLKLSMQWLGGIYTLVVLATLILLFFKVQYVPVHSTDASSSSNTMATMLIYWMSSPVANQILFFGFGQTMIQKAIGYERKIGPVPATVIIAALLFAVAACDSSFAAGSFSLIPTFGLGMFCSIAYWKTGSLITPMLGHAFFLGFPIFVHLLSNNV